MGIKENPFDNTVKVKELKPTKVSKKLEIKEGDMMGDTMTQRTSLVMKVSTFQRLDTYRARYRAKTGEGVTRIATIEKGLLEFLEKEGC